MGTKPMTTSLLQVTDNMVRHSIESHMCDLILKNFVVLTPTIYLYMYILSLTACYINLPHVENKSAVAVLLLLTRYKTGVCFSSWR